MPAISFQPEFLDALLSDRKQQTTRPVAPVSLKRPRFKVGDVAYIYNQQRRRIVDKPLRTATEIGMQMIHGMIAAGRYPPFPLDPRGAYYNEKYYVHFLGRVEITEVFDFNPSEMNWQELEAWAWGDDFADFATARCWFEIRYGARWMHRYWTVVRWDGWLERYFEPASID